MDETDDRKKLAFRSTWITKKRPILNSTSYSSGRGVEEAMITYQLTTEDTQDRGKWQICCVKRRTCVNRRLFRLFHSDEEIRTAVFLTRLENILLENRWPTVDNEQPTLSWQFLYNWCHKKLKSHTWHDNRLAITFPRPHTTRIAHANSIFATHRLCNVTNTIILFIPDQINYTRPMHI